MTEATATPTTPKASRGTARKPAVKAAKKAQEGLYAVFTTGGKQYRVQAGDMLKIEKLSDSAKASPDKQGWKEGDTLTFDQVLMTDLPAQAGNGPVVTLGNPFISGSAVTATLVKIDRLAKVIVIKYKQKSRYFKKNGHRQPYFQIRVDSIK